eukprot:g2810.t1
MFSDLNETVKQCSGCNAPTPCRPDTIGYGITEAVCGEKDPLRDANGKVYACGSNERGGASCPTLRHDSWCDINESICCPGETKEEEEVTCTHKAQFEFVECANKSAKLLDNALQYSESTNNASKVHRKLCGALSKYLRTSIYCAVEVGCSWKHAYDNMEKSHRDLVDECKESLARIIKASEGSSKMTEEAVKKWKSKTKARSSDEERDLCSKCTTSNDENNPNLFCWNPVKMKCMAYNDNHRCYAGEIDCNHIHTRMHSVASALFICFVVFCCGILSAICYFKRRSLSRREGASPRMQGAPYNGNVIDLGGAEIYPSNIASDRNDSIHGIPIGKVRHVEGVEVQMDDLEGDGQPMKTTDEAGNVHFVEAEEYAAL